MHRQIGGNHGQSRRHGFDQRVSEGLDVSRRDVEIAGSIHVVQNMIRYCPEFDQIRAELNSFTTVAPRLPSGTILDSHPTGAGR